MKHSLALWAAVAFPALPLGAQSVKRNGPFRSIRGPGVLAALLALALLVQPVLHAQRMQLSAPLEQVVAGKVLDQRVSADGSFLVYVADPLANERQRLVRRDLSGATAPIDLGVEIRAVSLFPARFEIDPTGARVVYLARNAAGWLELFSVPSDGSGPAVRLHPELPQQQFVSHFTITPDGAQVLYVANQDSTSESELYAVPIQGGPSVKISAPLPPGGDVLNFELARDGSTVVYRALVGPLAVDLFVGNLSGRQPARRLGPAHPQGRAVERFAISSQDEVLYLSDIRLDTRYELYAVPLAGGTPRLLNQPVSAGGVEEFVITPDGKRVVYNARVPFLRLFTVPVQGNVEPVQLDPDLSGRVNRFVLDATGRRVIFYLRRTPLELSQLLGAPVDGSQPAVRLDLDDVPGQVPGEHDFHLTPDGTRVVYDEGGTLERRVYVGPLDAAAPPLLLATMPREGFAGIDARSRYAVYGLTSLRLDGGREPFSLAGGGLEPPAEGQVAGDLVLYRATVIGDGFFLTDLYRVPVDGSAAPLRVNAPFPPGLTPDDVETFTLSTGSRRGAYMTSSGRLLRFAADASEPPLRLDDPELGLVTSSPVVSPDGSLCAFTQSPGLFLAPMDGGPAALLVPGVASPWQFTPDGRILLVVLYEDGSFFIESRPIDGSGPGIRFGPDLSSFLVTPDSARALFGVYDTSVSATLFSAPLDGSAPPLDLGLRLLPNDQVQLSPDGRHAVCAGQRAGEEGRGVFSVRVDGSAAPVSLVDLTDASLLDLVIDPSSESVILLVNSTDYVQSLSKVPIEGGAAPLPLLPPMGPGLALEFLALSADGAHVLLPSEAEVVEFLPRGARFVYDVLSVPTDGSQLARRLNLDRAGPGTVSTDRHGVQHLDLRLFAGPGHAVFPEGPRLVSATIGAPAERNVLAQSGAETVQHLRFTPDGRLAVFVRALADGSALYEAALDGSQPLRLLGAPAIPAGNVAAPPGRFFGPTLSLSADGAFAVYLGDLDEDELYELFASPLSSAPRRSGGPGETRRR